MQTMGSNLLIQMWQSMAHSSWLGGQTLPVPSGPGGSAARTQLQPEAPHSQGSATFSQQPLCQLGDGSVGISGAPQTLSPRSTNAQDALGKFPSDDVGDFIQGQFGFNCAAGLTINLWTRVCIK